MNKKNKLMASLLTGVLATSVVACTNDKEDNSSEKSRLAKKEQSLLTQQDDITKRLAKIEAEEKRLASERAQLEQEKQSEAYRVYANSREAAQQIQIMTEEAKADINRNASEVDEYFDNDLQKLMFRLLQNDASINTYIFVTDSHHARGISKNRKEQIFKMAKEHDLEIVYNSDDYRRSNRSIKLVIKSKISESIKLRDKLIANGFLTLARPIQQLKVTPLITLTDVENDETVLESQPQMIQLIDGDINASIQRLEALDFNNMNTSLLEEVLGYKECKTFDKNCISTLKSLGTLDQTVKAHMYISQDSNSTDLKRVYKEATISEVLNNRFTLTKTVSEHYIAEVERLLNTEIQDTWSGTEKPEPTIHANQSNSIKSVDVSFRFEVVEDMPQSGLIVPMIALSSRTHGGNMLFADVMEYGLRLIHEIKAFKAETLKIEVNERNKVSQMESLIDELK